MIVIVGIKVNDLFIWINFNPTCHDRWRDTICINESNVILLLYCFVMGIMQFVSEWLIVVQLQMSNAAAMSCKFTCWWNDEDICLTSEYTLSWIYILLYDNPRVTLPVHVGCFRASQSLRLLLNNARLAEKQLKPILLPLIWSINIVKKCNIPLAGITYLELCDRQRLCCFTVLIARSSLPMDI